MNMQKLPTITVNKSKLNLTTYLAPKLDVQTALFIYMGQKRKRYKMKKK